MLAGVVAGAVEACVTMPMEVTKTRQQYGAQRESVAASMRHAMRTGGGLQGLYPGLGLQVVQNAGKVGIRFAVYQGLSKRTDSRVVAGLTAGAVEALCWVTPCERLKVLRIRHPGKSAGELTRLVWREHGVRSLWVGGTPTLVRQSASVGFRFVVFDAITAKYCGGNAALGGGVVGALSTVLNNPIDVVKSEMQAARGSEAFDGVWDCVRKVSRTKGLTHLLFAGLPARLVKISLGQAVIFQVVAMMS